MLEQQLQAAQVVELARVIKRLAVARPRAVVEKQLAELRVARPPNRAVERRLHVAVLVLRRRGVRVGAMLEQETRSRELPGAQARRPLAELRVAEVDERSTVARSTGGDAATSLASASTSAKAAATYASFVSSSARRS